MATLKVLEDVVTTNALLYAYPEVKRAQAMAKKAGFTVKKNDGAGTLKVTTVVGEYKFQVRVHPSVCVVCLLHCYLMATLTRHAAHYHTVSQFRVHVTKNYPAEAPTVEVLSTTFPGTNLRATPSLWLDSLLGFLLCSHSSPLPLCRLDCASLYAASGDTNTQVPNGTKTSPQAPLGCGASVSHSHCICGCGRAIRRKTPWQ